jgi:phage terminase large subunit GpA-like protein
MSGLIRAGIAERRAKSFQYAGRIDPLDWAERIYRLPGGGRFRWSYAPYTRRIFQSYFDRATIETVLEMYSRGLKSTTVLLLLGYMIDQAPRPILSLWPTNGNAELWSKDVLTGELFDTTEPLFPLGSSAKKRTGDNTLLHKRFPGGRITMFGANAPGDMRRAKGSLLYADEIDAIKRNESDEGDPLAIFVKRGDEFPDTIRIFASYPSVRGLSRIDGKMLETDGNQWFSTCVRCGGEPFVMHRSMLRYDRNDLTGARLECPRCKELLTDAERYLMAHGQGFDNWRSQREFKGKRGFHGGAMLWPHPVDPQKYPGGFLQLLAQQEIDAEKSEDPKGSRRVLINTVDAECYDPTEDVEPPPDAKALFARREDYTEVPNAARVLNCCTRHRRANVGTQTQRHLR